MRKAISPYSMHDWTVRSVSIDWKIGAATISLTRFGDGAPVVIAAHDVRDIHIPRKFEWGPSVSILTTQGPDSVEGGQFSLLIQMQSGDMIRIVASRFDLPVSLVP